MAAGSFAGSAELRSGKEYIMLVGTGEYTIRVVTGMGTGSGDGSDWPFCTVCKNWAQKGKPLCKTCQRAERELEEAKEAQTTVFAAAEVVKTCTNCFDLLRTHGCLCMH